MSSTNIGTTIYATRHTFCDNKAEEAILPPPSVSSLFAKVIKNSEIHKLHFPDHTNPSIVPYPNLVQTGI